MYAHGYLSSKDIVLTNPRISSLLTPFSTSQSLILIANSWAVRSTPFTVFRGLENKRNLDEPLRLVSAPTDNRYWTTVDMPRAAAMMRGYSMAPVLDEMQFPTSPDAADLFSCTSVVEDVAPTIPASALGIFGLAPFSIRNLMHFKMTDSFTCRARTTSTRNVPPVRTRRLMAIGSYSFNNFFNIDRDSGFLEECAHSWSSNSALSLRDRSRL